MPTITNPQTHDHALAYSMLAAVGLMALGVVALWFFAS
jgi:hypothetical protein